MTEAGANTRWHLDLNWYQENGCSLFALVQAYFCPACAKKVKKETQAAEVIETISTCCSRYPGFFKPNAPILTTVFQIFLKNGNSPLSLEELAQELALHHPQALRLTPGRLERILMSDNYYGLRPAH